MKNCHQSFFLSHSFLENIALCQLLFVIWMALTLLKIIRACLSMQCFTLGRNLKHSFVFELLEQDCNFDSILFFVERRMD